MKKSKSMDAALVAYKTDNESEVSYIAKTYKIPIRYVRIAMVTVGKNGKPSRSRKMIYAELRRMGYIIPTKRY